MNRPAFAFAGALAAVGLAMAAAQAAPPPKTPKRGARPAAAVPADTEERLRSSDEGRVKGALDDVRAAGAEAAPLAPTISQVLGRGLPPPLAEAALDTLAEVDAKAAVQTFAMYTHHRSSTLRRAAARGLGRAGGDAAVATLRELLRDGDAGVRGLAATALGTLRARDAVGDLVLALDHRVTEAGLAVGQACEGTSCDQLLARLGALPFSVVGAGVEALLLRPAAEVDDERKLRIVSRIRELGTKEGHELLLRTQAKLGEAASPALKAALRDAIAATEASP
jgi:HEAT repeat protein